jgi:hypothetical protein
LEDTTAGSVRDGVYGPLYPVAEWFAANWWPLLNEVDSPERTNTAGFRRRHDLASAGEGYALPDLMILPEGEGLRLEWRSSNRPECQVRFLDSGVTHVRLADAESAFRSLIEAVLARLRDQGIDETPLDEEWAAIQDLDTKETEFCRRAGALGLDPFAASDSDARTIIEAAGGMSPGLAKEFFASANWLGHAVQADRIREFGNTAGRRRLPAPSLAELRTPRLRLYHHLPAWEQGYSLARQLRNRMELDGGRIRNVAALGEALDVPHRTWKGATATTQADLEFLDAMVAPTQGGGPYFAIHSRNETTRLFALCRALLEFLLFPPELSLVTHTRSERQRRNRAFAAEFLAPAKEVGSLIENDTVTEEHIHELAAEFGVSAMVIWHQIENHGLARTSRWPADNGVNPTTRAS